MSVRLGNPVAAAVSRLQEWQQLVEAAINKAVGDYLHGCADVAMARTPRQALAALHKAQRTLLNNSADTVTQAVTLWRKQSAAIESSLSSARSTKG